MSGTSTLSPEFQRAFVAMRYFLGARGEELVAPQHAGAEVVAVVKRLAQPDRQKRAEALAAEIGRVVRALEVGTIR